MLSKRYESTEVDRRTWLHVPSGTLITTICVQICHITSIRFCVEILLHFKLHSHQTPDQHTNADQFLYARLRTGRIMV